MGMLGSFVCFLFAGTYEFVISAGVQNCSFSASFVFRTFSPSWRRAEFILETCSRLVLDLCILGWFLIALRRESNSLRYTMHVVERCVCTLEYSNSTVHRLVTRWSRPLYRLTFFVFFPITDQGGKIFYGY